MTSYLPEPITCVSNAQHTTTPVTQLLADWAARGWLRELDAAFAEFLRREVPEAPDLLILAAALASHQLGRGHASLDLAATLDDPAFALSLPPEGTYPQDSATPARLPGEVLAGLTLSQWQAALKYPGLVASGPGNTPLVLAGSRLYLRRYWQYEQDVRTGIHQRVQRSGDWQASLPDEELRRTLDVLFPAASAAKFTNNWQKLACALAARSAFSIITGGPGTGKTTTVVKLLALLQALALARPAARPLRIRLAAPTGKAAARLNESISGAVAQLPLAELNQGKAVRAAIPTTVSTLHRLLGSRPDTRHFRHHAGNPLAVDVLVIDEASMVDLEMMTTVIAALPGSARLILLGDKDQLASVEAGAVLGELCQRAADGHYTPATCQWLETVTGETIDPCFIDEAGTALDQSVVMLRDSFRFSDKSGIGKLAKAVNKGDSDAVRQLWNASYSDLARLPLTGNDNTSFRALVIDGYAESIPTATPASTSENGPICFGYRHYLETLQQAQPEPDATPAAFDEWARKTLQAHDQFQILSALRKGPWGVEGLNQRIALLLLEAGLIPASDGWYLGRPVLVTRNDYGLGLMNGDIGITLRRPNADGQNWNLRVAFPAGDGTHGIKWVLPSRLQAVETVYALTVHKSQGSEFTHAVLVLPDSLNPILTRELIYTGITRAKTRLTLAHAGSVKVLDQAIARRVLRMSGLMAGEPGEVTISANGVFPDS